jgi:hypothetical protein
MRESRLNFLEALQQAKVGKRIRTIGYPDVYFKFHDVGDYQHLELEAYRTEGNYFIEVPHIQIWMIDAKWELWEINDGKS